MTPDLWAARETALRCQQRAEHAAAWHLVPRTPHIDGRRYYAVAHHDLALDHAWEARAWELEARQLAAEARAQREAVAA